MILPILFAVSLFMAMDLESFNRFFDIFVWIYLIAAIATVLAFRRREAAADSGESSEARVFILKKKVKTENLSWKQKFVGTWAKIERKGLYEFMLFNGAPSFVAYAQKDSDYGNIIEGKPENENILKLTATGFPPVQGQFNTIPDRKEDAATIDAKDPAGNLVTARMWWDTAEKKLRTEIKNPKKKSTTYMMRYIDENDVLHLKATAVKDEGGEASFDVTFRRKA